MTRFERLYKDGRMRHTERSWKSPHLSFTAVAPELVTIRTFFPIRHEDAKTRNPYLEVFRDFVLSWPTSGS